MYTGRLIEELIAAVERAENPFRARMELEAQELERLYLTSPSESYGEEKLFGVA